MSEKPNELCEFCGGCGCGEDGGFCDLCDATGLRPSESPKYRRAVELREFHQREAEANPCDRP